MRNRIVAGLLGIILSGVAIGAPPLSAPRFDLASGAVSGVVAGGVDQFLGVPFAMPPVGPLRWRSPKPIKRWSGVRPATTVHPGCVAPISGDGPARDGEDCLYLNIYRPAGTTPGAGLPIMVFLHGGGNMWGEPAIYDGNRMAAQAHAVVVIPSYRLGAFGFLSLGGLTDGSLALQDQVAALRWVRTNASAMGGAPDRVTLAGESAGAADVCALLASPKAEGLFSAAIMQSGFCTGHPDRQTAQDMGRAFVRLSSCEQDAADCVRTLPVDRITAAWEKAIQDRSVNPPLFPLTPVGTAMLPKAPLDAFRSRSRRPVPVLVGYDRDELRSFLWKSYPMDSGHFRAVMDKAYGAGAAAVEAEYVAPPGMPLLYVFAAARSDQMIICPSYASADALATTGPVAMFEFADRSAPPFKGLAAPHETPEGASAGAAHTSELRYLFDYAAVDHELSDDQMSLADRMVRMWVAFNSNDRGSGWAPYDTMDRKTTMITLPLAGGIMASTRPYDDHHCAFWAAHPFPAPTLIP